MLRWKLLILADRHLGWLGMVSILLLGVSMFLAWLAATTEMKAASLSSEVASPRPPPPAEEDVWRLQLKSELPQLNNSSSTQSELIRIANEHDIEIVNGEYRNDPFHVPDVYKVQVNFSLRGDYPSIRLCLREWLALPGMYVDRIQLEKGEAGLETQIELGWFYRAMEHR